LVGIVCLAERRQQKRANTQELSQAPVLATSCWPFHPSTAGSSSSETWRPAASGASNTPSSRWFGHAPRRAKQQNKLL